jgi:hypothetical protein
VRASPAKRWDAYPIRYAVREHTCRICGLKIERGSFYCDGVAKTRKAHTDCADAHPVIGE